MKKYNKTNWEDGKTPVNAENLNKIEEGLSNVTEEALRASDIVGGLGIETKLTEEGRIQLDMSSFPVNVIHDGRDTVEVPGHLYFVLDSETGKLLKIKLNNNIIFEIGG